MKFSKLASLYLSYRRRLPLANADAIYRDMLGLEACASAFVLIGYRDPDISRLPEDWQARLAVELNASFAPSRARRAVRVLRRLAEFCVALGVGLEAMLAAAPHDLTPNRGTAANRRKTKPLFGNDSRCFIDWAWLGSLSQSNTDGAAQCLLAALGAQVSIDALWH